MRPAPDFTRKRVHLDSERRVTVVVVGGGPAGAVAAALLSRFEISVLIVERGQYQEKSEVDVLSPEIQIELRRLGLWDRFTLARPMRCEAIQSAWGHRQITEQHFIRNPYGSGWCVRRSWLDALLFEHARDAGSAVVTQARPIRLSRTGGEWRLDVETPSEGFTVRSTFLVDASGRGASLARMLGVRRLVLDRMVGLSRLFPLRGGFPSMDPVLLLETHPLGWWYSAQVHPDELLVTLVTDGSAMRGNPPARERMWNIGLAGTPQTRLRSERCGKPKGLQARPAAVGRLDRAAGDGWLAVGDAASTFDPLSGSGVRKALVDAERAATAIRETLRGATEALAAYADGVAKSFAGHLRSRDDYYNRERRWRDSAFWSRAVALRRPIVGKTPPSHEP